MAALKERGIDAVLLTEYYDYREYVAPLVLPSLSNGVTTAHLFWFRRHRLDPKAPTSAFPVSALFRAYASTSACELDWEGALVKGEPLACPAQVFIDNVEELVARNPRPPLVAVNWSLVAKQAKAALDEHSLTLDPADVAWYQQLGQRALPPTLLPELPPLPPPSQQAEAPAFELLRPFLKAHQLRQIIPERTKMHAQLAKMRSQEAEMRAQAAMVCSALSCLSMCSA
jgi:hypothetical protein